MARKRLISATLFWWLLTVTWAAQAQEVNCEGLRSTIQGKISERFTESAAAMNDNADCTEADWENLLARYDHIKKERCRDVALEAHKICAEVSYQPPPENSGGGASNTSQQGTLVVTAAVKDFRRQMKKCGKALAKVPQSCSQSAEDAHRLLEQSSCSVAQLNSIAEGTINGVVKGVQRFCNDINSHLVRTKANLHVLDVAKRNLAGTNKQTDTEAIPEEPQ